jgi:hypothetical protein
MISKVSAIVGGVGGLIAAFTIFQLVNTLWLLPQAREEGRELERTATLQKSIELLKQRGATNAEIRTLDSRALCLRLGGEWVQNSCQ